MKSVLLGHRQWDDTDNLSGATGSAETHVWVLTCAHSNNRQKRTKKSSYGYAVGSHHACHFLEYNSQDYHWCCIVMMTLTLAWSLLDYSVLNLWPVSTQKQIWNLRLWSLIYDACSHHVVIRHVWTGPSVCPTPIPYIVDISNTSLKKAMLTLLL